MVVLHQCYFTNIYDSFVDLSLADMRLGYSVSVFNKTVVVGAPNAQSSGKILNYVFYPFHTKRFSYIYI